MKIYKKRTYFDQSSPNGILFFADAITLSHQCFEDYILDHGFAWEEWFDNKSWGAPIKNVEARYFSPLRPGQEYEVRVCLENSGKMSIQSHYEFIENSKKMVEVHLTHAFVDIKKMKSIRPEEAIIKKLNL